MSRKGQVTRVLVGKIPVFSRKLLIVDPEALSKFRLEQPRRGKKRDFSSSGAAKAVRLKLGAAELLDNEGNSIAIASAAPKNMEFPVYALVRDGKIVRIVVVFDEDPCRERPALPGPKTPKRRRKRS
jgi:hypothetical protein